MCIRDRIDSEDQRFDEILAKLEDKRTKLEEELRVAERARREAEEIHRRAEEFDASIEKDRDRALERAKAEAERLIANARQTADAVFDELDSIRKQRRREENYQQINDARAALRRSLNEAEGELDAIGKKKKAPKAEPMKRPLKIGDTVELLSLGTRATVLTLPDKNGNLQVQAGIMKVNVKLRELKLIEETGDKTVADFVAKKQAELRNITVKPEVDLRGMMPEEAESVLERYIDTAFLAKLNTVTIIHGKGTGVLRRTVQDHLDVYKRQYIICCIMNPGGWRRMFAEIMFCLALRALCSVWGFVFQKNQMSRMQCFLRSMVRLRRYLI